MDADADLGAVLFLSSAALSEIGGRVSNQDMLGSAQEEELACFVVADGVGGHRGGEVAARVVVDAVLERFRREALYGTRALRSYVDHAVAQVAGRKASDPALQDMSATVAAVLIDRHNRSALFAHLGDTRVYLFRHGRLVQRTRDHSLVQQFIDAGYCTPAQLHTHPLRSTLYAAVGIESETPVEPLDAAVALEAGDALLICTDGFWEWIDEAAMASAVVGAPSVAAWLDRMARLADANSRASGRERDNASAIAIWLTPTTATGQP